ncbi:MAG: 4Fe-4S binding protein [Calditrichaceae bacterium]|nr:4Fe-4S binding protein [Calditrichaceae bacterium]MBN2708525.1 4Fe-4S binding protein [Calditrichaceae bacterium]RQV93480.1 MAG: NADH:ubiquinone oxidoreductase [Calditrichota bacterium]
MNDAIKIRILQGDPIVHDVRNASFPSRYRGLPVFADKECPPGCNKCVEVCPTGAISLNPLKIDLGLCVFCPLCQETCPEKIIRFTDDYHVAAYPRERLIVGRNTKSIKPEAASEKIRKYFGKSLKLRQVSAGGCNGCELELTALSNVNFDLGRYGIEFTASPRHADGIVITGPITKNMTAALSLCYEAVPHPKIIILFGTCAISGGIFKDSEQIDRKFLNDNKIDLYIPGCPPNPLTFMCGLLDWLDR